MQEERTKSKRDREDPCYVCAHYHDFEGGEACSTCGHIMSHAEKKLGENIIPTAIIPGFLYLGSYDSASRSELLKTMGITHILNTVPKCEALYKNTFTYHTVSSSPPEFQECIDFIESVKQSRSGKVLVYCMSSISRSPTIVIGYLMRTRGWRLLESYKWVKEKRKSFHLTPDDQKRLIELEQRWYNSCSVPLGFDVLETGQLSSSTADMSGVTTAQPFSVPSRQWTLMPSAQPAFQVSSATTVAEHFVFGSTTNQGSASSDLMEM